MIKFLLYLAAAVVTGTGVALTAGLFTVSIVAALAKSKVGMDVSVAPAVQTAVDPHFYWSIGGQELGISTLTIVASIGFVIGFGVITWLVYGRKQTQPDPEEPGSEAQSKV